MVEFHKYVRTPHISGSRFQHGDHDLEAISWSEIHGKHLVVEEKIDGSNAGISFTQDGDLLIQSRGHYLRGGPREKQFEWMKQWAAAKKSELFDVLGSRYVMYGENMYAKHTCFYDNLPHYFMEFDIYDTEKHVFLDTQTRHQMVGHIVPSVLVLKTGIVPKLDDLRKMITRSNFITSERNLKLEIAAKVAGVDPKVAFTHTDMSEDMEGLYIKWEEDGIVRGRYKFVRETFTNSILEQETHWMNRPIIQNQLMPDAYNKMFA